jgi:hypothetical protein
MLHLKHLLTAALISVATALPMSAVAQRTINTFDTASGWECASIAQPTNPTTLPSAVIPAEEYKSHLQIGAGTLGLWQALFMELFMDVDIADYTPDNFSEELNGARYYKDREIMVNSLTLEYGYKVKDWLSLGAKGYVGFKTRPTRHIGTNEVLYRNNLVITSLLFNVRFDWLRREWVTMYSAVGAGAAVCIDKGGYADYCAALPMFDMTLVGINVGRRFYGFAEFGLGISGWWRAGIGVRF